MQIDTAAGGTFETVLGSTIKPLLSKIGEAVSFRLSDVIKTEGAIPYDAAPSISADRKEKGQVLYASMWIWSGYFRARHYACSTIFLDRICEKPRNIVVFH